MDIFETEDFREFTLNRFKAMPKGGHGQLKKLAEYLGVHTTFVSQVFKGEKAISAEQGIGVAEFLGLSDLETQYFIKLIQLDRAGTAKLKKMIASEAQAIKEQARKIVNRVVIQKVLENDQAAVFYSAWYYSAIRLLIGIEGYQDLDSIANRLGLPRKTVQKAIEFLLSTGLVVRKDGALALGPSHTHLDKDSPFVRLHHLNWRNRALQNLDKPDDQKLHYSLPLTMGTKDLERVHGRILKTIEEVRKIVDPSPSEELMCLNIDWFKIS